MTDTGYQPAPHRRPVFAVVDVETTGLDPTVEQVVEVAVCVTSFDFTPLSTWQTMTRPETPVTNSHIHGLTTADLASAPTFGEIAGALTDQLDGLRLVAHNSSFDASFLVAEYHRLVAEFSADSVNTWVDSLAVARRLLDGPHKLESLCEQFSVTNPQPHAAAGDAISTALVMQAISQTVDKTLPQRLLKNPAYRRTTSTLPAQRAPRGRARSTEPQPPRGEPENVAAPAVLTTSEG